MTPEQKPQKPRRRFTGARTVAAGAALAVAARVAVKRGPGLPGLSNLSALPDLVRDRFSGLVDHDDTIDDVLDDEDFFDDDEPEDEADEDFEDEADDEPEGTGDEEFEDEDTDEPEGTGDEDFDDDEPDEPEDGGDDFDDDEPDEPEGAGEEDFEDEEPEEPEEDLDDEPVADTDTNGGSGRRRAARSGGRDASVAEVEGNGHGTPDLLEVLSTQRRRPPALARAPRAVAERLDPVARPPEPPEHDSEDEQSGTRRKRSRSNASAKASGKRKAARR